MSPNTSRTPAQNRILKLCLASTLALSALLGARAAVADSTSFFQPGNLLVSRSVYADPGTLVPGVTQLPPDCTTGCATAIADGTYPNVWNNEQPDPSFGIASKFILDQMLTDGTLVNSLEVPNSSQPGITQTSDQMVTSFSSKSEGALNLSTDGKSVTLMGYLAPIGAIDASNSNTEITDPTNPVPDAYYRAVAEVNQDGSFHFTKTNAYSGNNGRAAILNVDHGTKVIYTAGNAGNGGNPQPDGIIIGAGAQIMDLQTKHLAVQQPGTPTPVGTFNVTELGVPADKIGKDTNFRGLTIFNNVVYFTKGSGGNGINTVYFVDTTGTACPNGVGLPVAGATLPTNPLAYDPSVLQTEGLTPNNMCILKGFPTALKTKTAFPFGVWFADANTLYVADEGDGTTTYNAATNLYTAAASPRSGAHPGLEKWVFDATSGQWKLAYTLTAGLDLGVPYTVPGYPTGTNTVTGLPWSPATDGLRNITGRVNGDGTVTVWGITSTVSGSVDQGADPNKLVAITDTLSATTLPAGEGFTTVKAAGNGEVLRGVSLTPGTRVASSH